MKLELRPSGAHRWMACPGAAWVATAEPERPSSSYAAEGSRAHAELSALLTGQPVELTDETKAVELPAEDRALIADMARLIRDLADLDGLQIKSEKLLHRAFGDVLIEGTADVVLVNEDRLIVLDYKHGAGRAVKAEGNAQLSLYALMALNEYSYRKTVEIGIIQPRGVGEGLSIWTGPDGYLETFAANVRAAIKKCYASCPTFNAGPWCWGCAGAELGMCPRKIENALRVAVGLRSSDGTQDELKSAWWLLDYAKDTAALAKKLEENARSVLESGGKVPGWMLVDTPGHSRWANPSEVADALAAWTGRPRSEFETTAEPRPIGTTKAKRICKGHPVESLIEKPMTKALVPASYADDLFDEVE